MYFPDDDCTSVVPISKLQSKNEDTCEVVWKRGQRYTAAFIAAGKVATMSFCCNIYLTDKIGSKSYCEEIQDNLDNDEDEEEQSDKVVKKITDDKHTTGTKDGGQDGISSEVNNI